MSLDSNQNAEPERSFTDKVQAQASTQETEIRHHNVAISILTESKTKMVS